MGDCCSREKGEEPLDIEPLRAVRMTRMSLRNDDGKLMAARGAIQKIHDNLHLMKPASIDRRNGGHLETTVYAGLTQLVVYSDYSTIRAVHANDEAERKLLQTVERQGHLPGEVVHDHDKHAATGGLKHMDEFIGHIYWEADGHSKQSDGPWPSGFVHMVVPRESAHPLIEHVHSTTFESMLVGEDFNDLVDIELAIGSRLGSSRWLTNMYEQPTYDVVLSFRFSPDENSFFSSRKFSAPAFAEPSEDATVDESGTIKYEALGIKLRDSLEDACGRTNVLCPPELHFGDIHFVHHSDLKHERKRDAQRGLPQETRPLITELRKSNGDVLTRRSREQRSNIKKKRDVLFEKSQIPLPRSSRSTLTAQPAPGKLSHPTLGAQVLHERHPEGQSDHAPLGDMPI
mmetsp:Transcript_34038/g.89499  ORF Transcript_34038/g.89499 Transcript_34038/m.89499 type:complete len:401 (-) Transcript_34038:479-1681(-)